MLATIPLDHIEIGRRLREVTDDQVDALMSSIADVGLLNPITVYPRKVMVAGISVDGYGLVAGAHRLEAARRLGLVDIAAHVVEMGELERQIAECDENLCASSLSPSERALFTTRRKEAYQALHPETVHGENQHTRSRKLCDSTSAKRFTADTAARTGASERAVQLDARRGEQIDPLALGMVRGTALDTGVFLDRLIKIKPENQCAYVERRLAALENPKPKPKATPPAPEPEGDYSVREKQITALMKAWNKAGKEAREAFLDRIGAWT